MIKDEQFIKILLNCIFPKPFVPLIKLFLKIPFVCGELTIHFDDYYNNPDDYTSKGAKFINDFESLVKEYKNKGFSYYDIVNLFEKQLSKYNIDFKELPKIVHRIYNN